MKDTFKTYPKCEECPAFKACPNNRAVLCETTRAIGNCPKDLWKKRIEKQLRELYETEDIKRRSARAIMRELLEEPVRD